MKYPIRVLAVLLIMALLMLSVPLQAQGVVLTLAIPDYLVVSLETALERFRTQHPDATVVVEPVNTYIGSAAYAGEDQETYFDNVSRYVVSGDVIYTDSYSLVPEVTRTGGLLDLNPLATGDAGLNPDDFYPAAWEMFQWDGGLWALPASVNVLPVIYNPAAFDAVGLSYPDESWTFNDYLDAARTLTQYDEQGRVTLPGFSGDLTLLLIASGIEMGDENGTPRFTDPTLLGALESWTMLYEELYPTSEEAQQNMIQYDYARIPLRIEQPYMLRSGMGEMRGMDGEVIPPFDAALLPNGAIGVGGSGFAVSAGTSSPELAYELAKYLSNNVDVSLMLYGDFPARRSLVGTAPENSDIYVPESYSPELITVFERGLENGVLPRQTWYSPYVMRAVQPDPESEEADLDLNTRLTEAETQVVNILRAAEEQGQEIVFSVPTPVPTPVLQSGEVEIRFLMQGAMSPLPNQEQWEAALSEFVANDPQVGNVAMDTSYYESYDELWNNYDCAYFSYAPFDRSTGEPPANILALEPLISADPNFNRADFVPGALEAMQYDGATYGYPFMLMPTIIWYDPQLLTDAGVPLPEQGWTTDQFIDALRALQSDPETSVISPMGGDMITILITAFGGVPAEFNIDGTIPQFTDPAHVEAARQALDLAREGVILYQPRAPRPGDSGRPMVMSDPSEAALLIDQIGEYTFMNRGMGGESYYDGMRATTLPAGSVYTPVSYFTTGAYISSSSLVPEACYRLITFLAERMDLLYGMPARLSLINEPAVADLQGAEVVEVYNLLAEQLADPNLYLLSNTYGSFDSYIVLLWLNQAYDAYVEEGGDLESMLADAQAKAEAFMQCSENIVLPSDLNDLDPEAQQDFYQQYVDCAIEADPSVTDYFPERGGGSGGGGGGGGTGG